MFIRLIISLEIWINDNNKFGNNDALIILDNCP